MKEETDALNLRNDTWLCSLSKVNDSILMWAHYCYNHKGVCIGLDIDNVMESVPPMFGEIYLQPFVLDVQYKSIIERPDGYCKAMELFNYQWQTKAKEWEYEQEVRLVMPRPSAMYAALTPAQAKHPKETWDWREIYHYMQLKGECFESIYFGVNIDELWVSQPDTGEQALEICENLVRSGAVDIIVIDSVAALTPQKEIEGEMGDSVMGVQARLMSQALRKLTAIVGKSKCTIVFINQIRMKIGVMFGNPETTTGGNALKFYSSIRLEIRRIETIEGKGDEDALGNRVRVKVVKNKVAPPFRKVELDIYFGKGVSASASILDSAVKHGLIDKRGAWYTRGEEKVGQGKENAVSFIENNPDYRSELEHTLREKIFPGQVLRTKEGEVVTEEQIREYEKLMRSKGVGLGNLTTDATPEPKAASSSSGQEDGASKTKASSKTSSLAKAAASDKPSPEDLF